MLEQNNEPRAVKSAFRALEVLQLLTQSARPLSFSDCQQALGYPKASLHGLLHTMLATGWITYDEPTRRYALGLRVWEAGIAYTRTWPLESLARPLLERVRDATSETVQLAVLDGCRALYVAKIDGAHMLRLESSVGLRLPPYATGAGKILLAGLSNNSLTTWLEHTTLERYTANTIISREGLLQEIACVRRVGYAVDREEIMIGATCVAVAVRNHLGATVAAMSVAGATARLRKREQEFALKQLRAAAAELSAALGYSGTPSGFQGFGAASTEHPST